jgi:hypothetical protein
VAHYALICTERTSHPKTWFLTRDGALLRAAQRLCANDPPFCFSLAGLLQSLSPFISSSESASFAEAFSSVVSDQTLPLEQVYDARELLVLAELHDDVRTTPDDQIVQAYEHVRRSVLHGRAARHGDLPAVALGLRSFLSSTAEERERALRDDAARLQAERQRALEEALSERELRDAADRQRRREQEKAAELALENERLRANDRARTGHLVDTEEKVRVARRNTAAVVMAVAATSGLAMLLARAAMTEALTRKLAVSGAYTALVSIALAIGGLAMAVLPVTVFLRRTRLSHEVRTGVLTVVAATALVVSNVVDDRTSSLWSSFLQMGSTVAMLVVPWVRERAAGGRLRAAQVEPDIS